MSASIRNVTVQEFSEIIKTEKGVLLDVRTPGEYSDGHLSNCTLIDFNSPDFPTKISALEKEENYFIYCRSGNRSMRAIQLMNQMGFKNMTNMDGGIIAWHQNGLPLEK